MKNKILNKVISWSLIAGITFQATPVWALTKDETIYTKLNSDGSVNTYVVSEHISGEGNDKSKLDNIKNVNGDEKYTNENGELVWENHGNDIYYQGTSDEELPISTSIKYYLNNKEMNVEDIIGKEGNVRIVIHYENNLRHYEFVNGKSEELYTPFIVATTSIISNTDNKNISVTNGKVIDNGVSSIVVGLSSPGLYESLDIEELKGFDTVEISYDTDNFELSSIYSAASARLYDNSDLDIFGNVSKIYDGINTLQSNMNTIVDGANELNEGSQKLANGTKQLNDGVNALTSKYYSYRNMDKEVLEKQIMSLIESNLEQLVPILEKDVEEEISKTIKDNKASLEESAIEVTKKNVKIVLNNEIDNIIKDFNMNQILEDIINSDLENAILNDPEIQSIIKVFEEELATELSTEVNGTTKTIVKGTISTISNSLNQDTMSDEEKVQYIQNIADKYGITFEQAAGIVSEVKGDTIKGIQDNLNKQSDTISTQVANQVTNQVMSSLNDKEFVNNAMNHYLEEVNKKLATTLDNVDIESYENNLKETLIQVIKKELSNNEAIQKYMNVSEYTDSVVNTIIDNTAKDLANMYTVEFAKQVTTNVIQKEFSKDNLESELQKILASYETDIEEKLNSLDGAVTTLSTSVSMLNDGANQLSNGMNTLNEGLNRYNTEGIQKISNFVNGDIKSLEGKIEALAKLSKEYKTFDDTPENASGSSKIIMVVDSIRNEEKTTTTKVEVIEEDKSLWSKIKGLFQ